MVARSRLRVNQARRSVVEERRLIKPVPAKIVADAIAKFSHRVEADSGCLHRFPE
jgi:hypothetical protein